jgi:hypothetical protein
MQGLVHVPDEMKDPAERHGTIPRSRAAYNVQIGLIRAHNVFWWWLDGLHTPRLPFRCIRHIDKVPGFMMERRVRADVVRPAGHEHEEKQIPLIRGYKRLVELWLPLRLKMRMGLEERDDLCKRLGTRLLQVCVGNRARDHMPRLVPGQG